MSDSTRIPNEPWKPPPGSQALFQKGGAIYLIDEHGVERGPLACGVQAVKVYLNDVLVECVTKFDTEAGTIEYMASDEEWGLRIERCSGKVRAVAE